MKTKKINVWVFVIALIMVGICGQQVQAATAAEKQAEADLKLAEGDFYNAMHTPEPQATEADVKNAASATGVGAVTTQISNMISKVIAPFKSAFSSLKNALTGAISSMKSAFDKVKKALTDQITAVKNMLLKLVNFVVTIYPKVEALVKGEDAKKLDDILNKLKDKTELTDAEKLQLAQAFVDVSKTSVAGLLTLVGDIFKALPDNIKNAEASNGHDVTQLTKMAAKYIDNTQNVSRMLTLPNPPSEVSAK